MAAQEVTLRLKSNCSCVLSVVAPPAFRHTCTSKRHVCICPTDHEQCKLSRRSKMHKCICRRNVANCKHANGKHHCVCEKLNGCTEVCRSATHVCVCIFYGVSKCRAPDEMEHKCSCNTNPLQCKVSHNNGTRVNMCVCKKFGPVVCAAAKAPSYHTCRCKSVIGHVKKTIFVHAEDFKFCATQGRAICLNRNHFLKVDRMMFWLRGDCIRVRIEILERIAPLMLQPVLGHVHKILLECTNIAIAKYVGN